MAEMNWTWEVEGTVCGGLRPGFGKQQYQRSQKPSLGAGSFYKTKEYLFRIKAFSRKQLKAVACHNQPIHMPHLPGGLEYFSPLWGLFLFSRLRIFSSSLFPPAPPRLPARSDLSFIMLWPLSSWPFRTRFSQSIGFFPKGTKLQKTCYITLSQYWGFALIIP